MRRYEYISKGGIYCYGKIEDQDFDKRIVITYVYHFLAKDYGDLYKGNFLRFGIHKIGNFFRVNGKMLAVIEEPMYYK